MNVSEAYKRLGLYGTWLNHDLTGKPLPPFIITEDLMPKIATAFEGAFKAWEYKMIEALPNLINIKGDATFIIEEIFVIEKINVKAKEGIVELTGKIFKVPIKYQRFMPDFIDKMAEFLLSEHNYTWKPVEIQWEGVPEDYFGHSPDDYLQIKPISDVQLVKLHVEETNLGTSTYIAGNSSDDTASYNIGTPDGIIVKSYSKTGAYFSAIDTHILESQSWSWNTCGLDFETLIPEHRAGFIWKDDYNSGIIQIICSDPFFKFDGIKYKINETDWATHMISIKDWLKKDSNYLSVYEDTTAGYLYKAPSGLMVDSLVAKVYDYRFVYSSAPVKWSYIRKKETHKYIMLPYHPFYFINSSTENAALQMKENVVWPVLLPTNRWFIPHMYWRSSKFQILYSFYPLQKYGSTLKVERLNTQTGSDYKLRLYKTPLLIPAFDGGNLQAVDVIKTSGAAHIGFISDVYDIAGGGMIWDAFDYNMVGVYAKYGNRWGPVELLYTPPLDISTELDENHFHAYSVSFWSSLAPEVEIVIYNPDPDLYSPPLYINKHFYAFVFANSYSKSDDPCRCMVGTTNTWRSWEEMYLLIVASEWTEEAIGGEYHKYKLIHFDKVEDTFLQNNNKYQPKTWSIKTADYEIELTIEPKGRKYVNRVETEEETYYYLTTTAEGPQEEKNFMAEEFEIKWKGQLNNNHGNVVRIFFMRPLVSSAIIGEIKKGITVSYFENGNYMFPLKAGQRVEYPVVYHNKDGNVVYLGRELVKPHQLASFFGAPSLTGCIPAVSDEEKEKIINGEKKLYYKSVVKTGGSAGTGTVIPFDPNQLVYEFPVEVISQTYEEPEIRTKGENFVAKLIEVMPVSAADLGMFYVGPHAIIETEYIPRYVSPGAKAVILQEHEDTEQWEDEEWGEDVGEGFGGGGGDAF